MKSRRCALLLTVALLLTMATGCTTARQLDAAEDRIETQLDIIEDTVEDTLQPTPPGNSTIPSAPSETITQADAEEIALSHAGLTADQVTGLYTKYEIDDRIPKYEVQFYVDRLEYDYDIHAETGEILSFEKDT